MLRRTLAAGTALIMTLVAACGGDSNPGTGPGPNPGPAPVASVTLTPATSDISQGGTKQFTAAIKDATGNMLAGRAITWSSSANAVATVDAAGKGFEIDMRLVRARRTRGLRRRFRRSRGLGGAITRLLRQSRDLVGAPVARRHEVRRRFHRRFRRRKTREQLRVLRPRRVQGAFDLAETLKKHIEALPKTIQNNIDGVIKRLF